ncbi:hypothetical protein [Chiayiivirga flava]|uniref:Putative delta-60 repeat protein n=1 Tax=Chiayiivirga flava TaxID=659595 RepID=A0A7W8D7I6_9GAMM|nr:hypothetical protein [Chiayiivirga flava]MBB5209338.1 putative delta-60 repeat protein [Chiayiivirga flava]
MVRFRTLVLLAALVPAASALAIEPGTPDPLFGTGGTGFETVSYAPDLVQPAAAIVAADGSIYIGGGVLGQDSVDLAGVHLLRDGSFDPGYGKVRHAIPGYTSAFADDFALQPDGKLLVAARVSNPASRWAVCRLRVDGDLDPDFGDVQTPGCTTPLQGEARAIVLQSDGRIVVAGSDNFGDPSRAALIRLSSSGVLDTSFAGGDTVAVLPEELAARSSFNDLVLGPDDTLVASGSYGPQGDDQFMAARFDADGELDESFSQDGVRLVQYTLLPPGERLNIANGLALLPDGAVLVSGTVYVPTNGGSMPRIGIVKLDADGALSSDFVSDGMPDGQLLIDPCVQDECDIWASDLAVLPNGRILLAGGARFGDLDIPTVHTLRLLPDGQLDPGWVGGNNGEFAPGLSLTFWDGFSVSDLLLQGDRPVVVGERLVPQDMLEIGAYRLAGERLFGDSLESD